MTNLDCAASVPTGVFGGDGNRIPHPDGIFLAVYRAIPKGREAPARRFIVIGFVVGAIAGGVLVWFWGDRLRQLAEDTTDQARDKVARGLENVQATAESAIDSAKEQIRGGLKAGQDYIRPEDKTPPPTYR
jgi:hypothetical protein